MEELWGNIWNVISSDFGTGLIGALIGGGFTILGSAWQTRSANKAAERAHTRETARQALATITALSTYAQRRTYIDHGTFEDREEWNHELETQRSTLVSLLALLPDGESQTRSRCIDLLMAIKRWERKVWPEYRIYATFHLAEMALWLAALARGSKPPKKSDVLKEAEKRVISLRREALEYELADLEQRAEDYGLDPGETQRAEDIRTELASPALALPVAEAA
ncbi:hypothetical protein [Streptomyces sp. NPDC046979]|uniref:hypothetical protein n=1 Tax=Streptomyces sp. NPDC046979 TaxID=3154604 RepID=UPI0033C5B6B0